MQTQYSSITNTTTEEPDSRLPPNNPVKETLNKPTENNDVSDAANVTKIFIDTLPRTTPPQLSNITSKELVVLANSNPRTKQPPKLTVENDISDTDMPKTITITSDPVKLVMMNAAKGNQITKRVPKYSWRYEFLNYMYVKIRCVDLSANSNTVYFKDCNKYIVMI